MENEIIKALKSRRSIRKYQEAQIDPSQLDALLEAATWAPSGSNSQSWLFTAIQNKNILLDLNETVREAFQRWAPDDAYPAKKAAKANSQKADYNFYYQAPTLIIASNIADYQNALADCSAALQNIFLAAYSLGLGSCWINQLHWLTDDGSVRDFLAELGVPRNHLICGAAAIGYPAQDPAPPQRKEGTTLIIR